MLCNRGRPPYPTKVAFQGEPGAYSEKCLREMLGQDVIAVGRPSFEDVFRSVSNREADYAVIPIENSLGGSIHANYDLLLRFELFIIGEHDFKVEHSLMALPGTKASEIKQVLSHQQALAQCDNYLRAMPGVERVPTYDTAGSAKMIAEKGMKGCAAIASELAAETYGLEVLATNIEDDHVNFTRFLLLARQPVGVFIAPPVPAKTSVVFTLPNTAGALYKALACFSLRDIDFSKIESRPTSAQLLQYLRYQLRSSGSGAGGAGGGSDDLPRFQYCFYLDFLAAELDDAAQSALAHLREVAPFMRVLGSYPRQGQLVGPVRDTLEALRRQARAAAAGKGSAAAAATPSAAAAAAPPAGARRLNIGVVGFGKFGQFIARAFARRGAAVRGTGRTDETAAARAMGARFYPMYEQDEFFRGLDVVVFAVSILSFEEVLRNIPAEYLRGKLVVDVLSVKVHAKKTMLDALPGDADILCTHPMFGPESGRAGWQSLPFVYDKVRVGDHERASDFLAIWEQERCKMVEMSCELHDEYAANTQFITHLMGRILGEQRLAQTPIDTRGFQSALRLMETTCSDSFDLFYGLYKFNAHSHETLRGLRESFAQVERQLAAKEAYMAAKADMASEERQRILAEVRGLLREAARAGLDAAVQTEYAGMRAIAPTAAGEGEGQGGEGGATIEGELVPEGDAADAEVQSHTDIGVQSAAV
ncbi:Trifunctional chorismate Mutase/Prephenate Dehydratase/Prephenate dehydrogenase [Tribonema minus]|uniref:prephenate dehydratase n=1 Tax=Tribonema minus TaxID=303371 RepID=A0A835YRB8_9STRA|nr:Trifunctional chorismate Mutase/Prephenate Dehydratase/Prephenate dehydrogenase [Tribonema minus]